MGELANERCVIVPDDNTGESRVAEEEQSCRNNIIEVVRISDLRNFSGDKASTVVFLCSHPEHLIRDDSDLLGTIIEKILKPSGKFHLKCASQLGQEAITKLSQHLKWNGFVSVTPLANNHITAEKDKFEVGDSVLLTFAKPSNKPDNQETKTAWTVSADDDYDNDEELIDEDALLDDDDLKKPDPASLRVCGTTGKRKACKDCSCGLAEELEGEEKTDVINTTGVKSSCGSCYLGDAFRCASCPYMGMPAFKPGEKIQLSDSMLAPDV